MQGYLESQIKLTWNEHPEIIEYSLREPLLYGDFRNACNDEPRFYEDVLDYEAVYSLFMEVYTILSLKIQ